MLPTRMLERVANDKVEAAAGVLILLVILGHASNFLTPEPYMTFSIKFFHVACFLLFPFIYDIKLLSWPYVRDRFARYYIPFACFLILYGMANLILIRGVDDVFTWALDMIKAAVIGNTYKVDAASGFRSLWFMPTLMLLVFAKSFILGTSKLPLKFLLPLAFLLHVTAGLHPEPLKHYLAFGLTIVCYLFFLGLIARLIFTRIEAQQLEKLSPIFLLTALGALTFAGFTGSLITLPIMHLPSLVTLLELVTHDAIILSVFAFLLSTPWLRALKWLKWCGRNSLILYLGHLGFFALSYMVMNHYISGSHATAQSIAAILIIFVFSLFGGVLCAMIVNRSPLLKSLIAPHTWQDWYTVKRTKQNE